MNSNLLTTISHWSSLSRSPWRRCSKKDGPCLKDLAIFWTRNRIWRRTKFGWPHCGETISNQTLPRVRVHCLTLRKQHQRDISLFEGRIIFHEVANALHGEVISYLQDTLARQIDSSVSASATDNGMAFQSFFAIIVAIKILWDLDQFQRNRNHKQFVEISLKRLI